MTQINLAILILAFVSCTGCNDDPLVNKGGVNTDCPNKVIVSNDQYLNADNGDLGVSEIQIDGNCITVTINSSGCDGSRWELDLIDAGDIAESLPPQRSLRFDFVNTEECDAVITKEYSFDISSLQVDGPSVFLNFMEFDESILYEY